MAMMVSVAASGGGAARAYDTHLQVLVEVMVLGAAIGGPARHGHPTLR